MRVRASGWPLGSPGMGSGRRTSMPVVGRRGSRRYGSDFQAARDQGSARSASVVVPIVSDWLQPRSVVDVGCSSGAWLAEFKRHGATTVVGVDGADVDRRRLLIDEDELVCRDLRQPLGLGQRFDLALSLEVAEHLPAEHADDFVATLADLAPAVLFSAAVPHQGGTGHCNEQWPGYWAGRFEDHGYLAVDAVRPLVWASPDVEFWYAQNTLLFAEPETVWSHPVLARAAQSTDAATLARIHPEAYLAKVNNERQGRGRAILRAAKARLGR